MIHDENEDSSATRRIEEGSNKINSSIWDFVTSEYNQKHSDKWMNFEDMKTLFVLGSSSSGKTTIIWRLLDKNDNLKPTLALDFTFARRTTSNYVKEVSHIWELGGDCFSIPTLIETPFLSVSRLDQLILIIVVDLSSPEKIWPVISNSISIGKKAIKNALSNLSKADGQEMAKKMETNLQNRIGQECQDREFIEPFPVPLAIIGTKYDIYQNFEPEKRKLIAKMLRLVSHKIGASLTFYSNSELSHNKRIRELLSHYAFNTTFPKGMNFDMNKPLLIPHGSDVFTNIWPNSNPSQFTLDYLKHLFESTIGKFNDNSGNTEIENPAEDPNFKEKAIDEKRSFFMENSNMIENVREEFYHN